MSGDISKCHLCGTDALYCIAFEHDGRRSLPLTFCSAHAAAFWRKVRPLHDNRISYLDQRIAVAHAPVGRYYEAAPHVA